MITDIQIYNEGSIVLLQPKTQTAINWIEENIGQNNGFQPYWPTVTVEARFVENILCGMQSDGLKLS